MNLKHNFNFSSEVKAKIVEMVLEGRTWLEICKHYAIPQIFLFDALEKDPFFKEKMREARVMAQHNAVDSLKTIADDCVNLTDVGIAKLKSDNIKWMAGKIAPKDYGDSLNVNVQQTIDLSAVLAAASGRVIPMLDHKKAIESANTRDVSENESNTTGSKPVDDPESEKIEDLL